jgi:tetratricopeptide (TPR) repeat protein
MTMLFSLLLCATSSAFAQGATDFYLSLLRRGIAAVDAGQFAAAATPLRIAAFGLVDSIESYETALVHLAIAQDRLGNQDGARESVRRLVAAERIDRKFAALRLTPATRTAFDAVARKHLGGADVSALATGAALSPEQPRSTPVTTQQPSNKPAPAPARPQTNAPQQPQQNPPAAQPKPQTPATSPKPATNAPPSTAATSSNATPSNATPNGPSSGTATTNIATTQPRTEPKPEVKKPEPKPAAATAAPVTKPPVAPAPTTTNNTPAKPGLSAKDVATRLAAAERALAAAQLPEARRIYREILDSPGIDRDSILHVAEGSYRARDFAGTLAAFKALGPLKRGEEPYGYYYAVSLYETGAYDAAKKAIAAALPFIEMTPDVVRYRTKIEGAR